MRRSPREPPARSFDAPGRTTAERDAAVTGYNILQGPKVTERPAGLPKDAAVVGVGKQPIGVLLLGEDQIAGLQTQLKAEGFYRGNTGGKITRNFADGLARFQKTNGISVPPGTIDLATLAWFPSADIQVKVGERSEMPGMEKGKSTMPERGKSESGWGR